MAVGRIYLVGLLPDVGPAGMYMRMEHKCISGLMNLNKDTRELELSGVLYFIYYLN